MKSKELRDLSIADIEKKIVEIRAELTMLRMKKQTGGVEQSHLFVKLRRDVARMLTIIAEKKRAQAVAS